MTSGANTAAFRPLRMLKSPIIIEPMERRWRRLLGWGLAGALVLLIVVLADWNSLVVRLAIVASERRPGLLSDAQWRAPASARKFAKRFGRNVPEADLVSWLRANKFQVDQPRDHARRLVMSLPCNELININWTDQGQGRLAAATAEISEAGCL